MLPNSLLGRTKEKHVFLLFFARLFVTLQAIMKHSDKWTNAILAVLAAVLLALCVRSIVHEKQLTDKQQEQRDGRDN